MPSEDLALLMREVADHLLGAPNGALSGRGELRYGRRGSLSVDLKKGTWFDWEAAEGGGVVDLVRREMGLDTREAAAEWLRAEHYLDEPRRAARVIEEPPPAPAPDQDQKFQYAIAAWRGSVPAQGTPVEAYLRSRAITLLPYRLRYFAGLRHIGGTYHPAMVALVTRGVDDRPLAVHRTYLAEGGGGKADVAPQKLTLGSPRGGCVKMCAPAEHLLVGEGLETCLSAMQMSGVGAWAALSTSGLKSLELPAVVRRVTVLADYDPVNKYGVRPGEAAARSAAARWRRQGRDARIAWPEREGQDFNDILMEEVRTCQQSKTT